MSGHPHTGKRSKWFKCNHAPPTAHGLYEWCHDPEMFPEVKLKAFTETGMFHWNATWQAWYVMPGWWRGLAEKPE